MFGLSCLLRAISSTPRGAHEPSWSEHFFRPFLEELGRREVPAPLATGLGALTGSLATQSSALGAGLGPTLQAQTPQSAATQVQSVLTSTHGTRPNVLATQPAQLLTGLTTSFNPAAPFARTATTGPNLTGFPVGTPTLLAAALTSFGNLASAVPPPNITTGFSTVVVSPGNIAAAPFAGPLFPGTILTPVPIAINAGLPTFPALGTFASLPRRPTYITEAVSLSGGGTSSTVEPAPQQPGPATGSLFNPLIPVEVTDASQPGAALPSADAVLELAILHLTN